MGELFNQPVEVHTFELGLLVGVIFGLLLVRYTPKLAALVSIALLLFLFGSFDLPALCTSRTESCAHVQLKPWYFLGGWATSVLLTLGASHVHHVREEKRYPRMLELFSNDFERIAAASGIENRPDTVVAYLIRQYDETTPDSATAEERRETAPDSGRTRERSGEERTDSAGTDRER